MSAVEKRLPPCARVIRWCVHSASARSDAVGCHVAVSPTLSWRPSLPLAKIVAAPLTTFTPSVSARFGFVAPDFAKQGLDRLLVVAVGDVSAVCTVGVAAL